MAISNVEVQEALALMRSLFGALSKSDPSGQFVNKQLQKVSDFLARYGADQPRF